MNTNVKSIFLVFTFIALLITVSAISATDISDTDNVLTESTQASVDNNALSEQSNMLSDNNVQTDTKNELKKVENKNLKRDNPIEITNSTFNDYFTDSVLNPDVDEGSVLDFKGLFNSSSFKMTIDRPVNITSSDNSAIIDLNTTGRSYYGDDPGDAFMIDSTNNVNVSNIKFHNTQIFVKNSEDIIFNHVNVTVENQQVGSGVGVTSIRDGSLNVIVANSTFYTEANGGSSTLVLAGADNCIIENNQFTATGYVGNVLYLTTYNVYGLDYLDANTNSFNTIRNNTLTITPSISGICYGIAITGHDNLITNNTVNYNGQAITTQWNSPTNDEDGDNDDRYLGNEYTYNIVNNGGSVKLSSNSTASYNNFTGNLNTSANSTATNNKILGNLIVYGNNSVQYNNVTGTTTIYNSNSNITDNKLLGQITLSSGAKKNKVINNQITTNIVDNSGSTGNNANTISPNTIISNPSNFNSPKQLKGSNEEENIKIITNENYLDYFTTHDDGNRIYLEYNTFNNTAVNTKNNAIIIFNETLPDNISGILFSADNITISANVALVNKWIHFENCNQINVANMTLNYTEEYLGSDEYADYCLYTKENVTNINFTNVTFFSDIASFIKDDNSFDAPFSAIEIDGNETIFKNCNITILAKAYTVNWDDTESPLYGQNRMMPIGVKRAIHSIDEDATTIFDGNFISINATDADGSFPTIYGMYLYGTKNILKNNEIILHGEGWTYGIETQHDHNIFENNTIHVSGKNYTAGIYLENPSHNLVTNNTIILESGTTQSDNSVEYVTYGVVITDYAYQGGTYKEGLGEITNNSICNNTIIGTAFNSYAIEQYGGDNSTITNNNITLTSDTAMGIGVIGANNLIANNTIFVNGTSLRGTTIDYLGAMTAGVATKLGLKNTISDNNITSTKLGINIFCENYDTITNNHANTSYDYSMELNKNKYLTCENNTLSSLDKMGEESINLTEANRYIFIFGNDTYTSIGKKTTTINGTINFVNNDTAAKNLAFEIYEGIEKISGRSIKSNYKGVFTFKYTPKTAGDHVLTFKINDSDNPSNRCYSTEQNITVYATNDEIIVNPISAKVGDTVNVTANVYSITGDTVTSGKVTFKVNGKTLKDDNGKVIYIKVVNGTATLENYVVPQDWTKENSTIQAIYGGSKQAKAMTSTKVLIDIEKPTPIFTTSDVTATAGESINLTASIADGDKQINVGKVVFKINGKTVKDSNGKVIYVNVSNNQANIEYKLMDNMKAKDYNITAVFLSPDYDKLEDTKTLTITA